MRYWRNDIMCPFQRFENEFVIIGFMTKGINIIRTPEEILKYWLYKDFKLNMLHVQSWFGFANLLFKCDFVHQETYIENVLK